MKVTKAVIEDLVPAYLSGEASADTRELVDEFVELHPEMRAALRDSAGLPSTSVAPAPELGLRALDQTRKLMQRRNAWLGWGFALAFFVFSFVVQEGRLTFLLFRDAPAAACALLAGSAICLAMFYRVCRRLVVTGLGAPYRVWVWAMAGSILGLPLSTVSAAVPGWPWLSGLAVLPAVASVVMAVRLNRIGRGEA